MAKKGQQKVNGSKLKPKPEAKAKTEATDTPYIEQLRKELEKERQERNYFQLERDKIYNFWEITKQQLEENKAELRLKDTEMDEAAEKHLKKIKVYEQKIKHLQYEHQCNIADLKAKAVVATKVLEKDHADLENDLKTEIHILRMDLKKQALSTETQVKNLKLTHNKEISKLRKAFEENIQEAKARYEKKMEIRLEEQDLRHKAEINETEQTLNCHIDTLLKDHEKAFSDIKNYYNNLIQGNITQIQSFMEREQDVKSLEKERAKVLKENKNLSELLMKATQEVSELQKQIANYKQDKDRLAHARARIKVADQDLKNMKWENRLLEHNLHKVQQEHDELNERFTKAILEVQKKSGFKNLLLGRKLKTLRDSLKKQ